MTYSYPVRTHRAQFSIPSIIAIVVAIVSFFVGAGWAMLLAIIAIIFGLLGFVMALAPGVRGGVTSVISILAGVLGIVVAVIRLVV